MAQDSPPFPASAISLAAPLMRHNPCEVLASLQLWHDEAGKNALIGYTCWPLDGNEDVGRDADSTRGGVFRCSLETARHCNSGEVLVTRFAMETDEEFPRQAMVSPSEMAAYRASCFVLRSSCLMYRVSC